MDDDDGEGMDVDGSDDTQPSSVGYQHQHMPELISDGGNSGLSGEDDSTPATTAT